MIHITFEHTPEVIIPQSLYHGWFLEYDISLSKGISL